MAVSPLQGRLYLLFEHLQEPGLCDYVRCAHKANFDVTVI